MARMDKIPPESQDLIDALEHPDPSDWSVGWGEGGDDAWSDVTDAEPAAQAVAAPEA